MRAAMLQRIGVFARHAAAASLTVVVFGVSTTAVAAAAGRVGKQQSVTIAAVGDVTLGEDGWYPRGGPMAVFGGVLGALRAPVALGNLETALAADGPSLAGKCRPESTNCFTFDAPGSFAAGLRTAGFTMFNLANNHTNDYGAEGKHRTVDALARAGLHSTGGPGQITVINVSGLKVAFLGFAPYPSSASLLDLVTAKRLVAAAARRAEIVVVSMHAGAEGTAMHHVPYGSEYYLGENRGDARAFSHAVIDAGADLVVGHGPHVLRGLEWYRGRLIAYSLGNFSAYHTLSLTGELAYTTVLRITLDSHGRFKRGHFVPIHIAASGDPQIDRSKTSLTLLRRLSIEDFGPTAAIVDADGRIEERTRPVQTRPEAPPLSRADRRHH